MKRGRSRLFLLLGLLLVVVLVVAGYLLLTGGLGGQGGTIIGGGPTSPPTPIPQVRVLVANRTIPANTVLTPDMIESSFDVKLLDRDKLEIPIEGIVGSKTQLLNKVTRLNVESGQILESRQFMEITLSFEIPEGKRAVPLKVDESSGVVGLIAPDDFVNIIFSGQLELHFPQPYPPTTPGEFVSISPANLLSVKTIIQDIQILRVISITAPVVQPTGKPQPTAEAEVAPAAPAKAIGWMLILAMDDQQIEVLKFALEQQFPYMLSLRPHGDHSLTTTTGITTKILIEKYGVPVPAYIAYPITPGVVPSGIIP